MARSSSNPNREEIFLADRSGEEEDRHNVSVFSPTIVSEHSHLISQQSSRPRGRSSLFSVSFPSRGLIESVQRLRDHTTTVSLLAKPSFDRRASAFLAGWNVSNLIQGTGILGVPYGVFISGWAGVAAIVVVAVMCCFTGKILIDCLYEKSKRTGQRKRVRANYPEIGEAVWPRWGNTIVSITQV